MLSLSRSILGMVLTAGAAFAAPSAVLAQEGAPAPRETAPMPSPQRPAFGQPAMPIQDVALSQDGVARGRVLDENGKAVDGALVVIRRDDEVLHKLTTDTQGRFAAEGVRPGMYTIETVQGGGVYRMWPPNIAPPSARQQALVIADQPVLRAQFGRTGAVSQLTTMALAGGALGVGIAALIKIEDVQDDVNDLKSP